MDPVQLGETVRPGFQQPVWADREREQAALMEIPTGARQRCYRMPSQAKVETAAQAAQAALQDESRIPAIRDDPGDAPQSGWHRGRVGCSIRLETAVVQSLAAVDQERTQSGDVQQEGGSKWQPS
jgi:hypothetical protein